MALVSVLCVGVIAQNAPQNPSVDKCENTSLAKCSSTPDASKAMWDVQFTFTAIAAAHPAVATDGNYFYTAAWQSGYDGPITRYNMDGSNPTNLTISGVSADIRSLTYDGQYFYAGRNNTTLYKLDLTSSTLIGTVPVTCSGVSAVRHITFDPTLDNGNGGFWVGEWTSMGAITKNGTQIFPNFSGAGVSDCYGSAYDASNNCIWLNTQRGGTGNAWIEKFDLTTHTVTQGVHNLNNEVPGGSAIGGGAFIYKSGGKVLLAANAQVSPNVVIVYEVGTDGDPCPAVTAVTATQFEANKVKVNWTAPTVTTDLTNYKIYQNGVAKGDVPAGTTTWTSGALESGTYTFAVEAIYSSGCIPVKVPAAPITIATCDKKVTNVAVAYATDCSKATITWTGPTKDRDVIFSAGFEGTTGTSLPTGWTTAGGTWVTMSNASELPQCGDPMSPHGGTRMMGRSWSYSGNNWVFSPGFELTAGKPYTISYWFSAPGWPAYGETDDHEMRIGKTPSATGMASAFLVYQRIGVSGPSYPDYGFAEATNTFTPTESGIYYLGLHDLTPVQEGLWLIIDDVSVSGESGPPQPPKYNVYRDDVKLTTTPLEDITTFDDTTFDKTQPYKWSVAVVCPTGGDGEWVGVDKNACFCPSVTSGKVEFTEAGAVLTWTAIPIATGYKVSRDGVVLGTVTEPTYTQTGIFESGVTYKWEVVTLCAGGGESIPYEISGENNIKDYTILFSIVPNPATDNITIKAGVDFNKIEVINFLGQSVITQSVVGQLVNLDVSTLTNGVYFVRLTSEKGTSVKKFVKQ